MANSDESREMDTSCRDEEVASHTFPPLMLAVHPATAFRAH
jgi:hypothetical protein